MKTIALVAFAFLNFVFVNAQTSSYLVGTYWNGSSEISRHLNYNSGVYSNLSTVTGVAWLVQGESAFDATNNRYFNKTNLGLTILDAISGTLLGVINTTVPVKGIEYNSNTGKLIGTYWNGSAEIFVTVDISTGAVTNVATLPGITSIAQGESSYDPAGNKYFIKTGVPSICVIDASTGAIINSISNSNFKGFQFNPSTGDLIGSYWTGSVEVLASMNIVSGAISNIATLTGVNSLAQGESTIDFLGNVYFNNTNLGITVINAQTGAILNTIAGFSGLKGMEYMGSLNNCNYSLNMTSPSQVYVSTGNNTGFICASSAPSPSYQWQSNPANFGWMNVPNNANYSGANSSALLINNVTLQNHLQQFRVIVSSGTCSDTSVVAMIHVSDTCLVVADTLEITALTNNSTSFNESINVYPNPATNYLIIDGTNVSNLTNYSAKIISMTGQQLYSQKLTEKHTQVDLNLFSAKGIYYLQILDSHDTIVESKKIILK